ncbi:hypothetical protein ACFFKU_14930 [Kineococcus gynurae]|uniref:Maltokinase N-terminal cap domain-containing protein n=1 Tax=Kineococcus gynurae TaxID=452979 RepID=A0ABV5LTK2_9ACTN
MAVHHPATIVPTKLELLRAWVPRQPWAGGVTPDVLTQLGAYRFDDPDGEVGIETHLLGTASGQVLQVPLTYRGAPREGADATLVTTMTHTTLGDRWIYDACHDPVYPAVLAEVVRTAGREAELFTATPDGLVPNPLTTHVRGSGGGPGALGAPVEVRQRGADTRIRAGSTTLVLHRRPDRGASEPGPSPTGPSLTGTWPGQDDPVLLVSVEER